MGFLALRACGYPWRDGAHHPPSAWQVEEVDGLLRRTVLLEKAEGLTSSPESFSGAKRAQTVHCVPMLNFETFPALEACPGIIHGFTIRVPGIDVKVDREVALERLSAVHAGVRSDLGCANKTFCFVNQVHGSRVIDADAGCEKEDADGLISSDPSLCLGVYVADCGPVYAVDPVKKVIGLFHSGRKGTDFGITRAGLQRMVNDHGASPGDMTVFLGPCIRPPHYEIDFASAIVAEAKDFGVGRVVDCGICTASNPERYYSYRREKGSTGRMLALLAIADSGL